MDGKITKHESFGMVGISRISGSKMPLFGSSIMHTEAIRLSVRNCELRRDLHRDWYFGEKLIVQVDLSPAQFCELITTPNIGYGVPCTIRHDYQGGKEDPPFEAKGETFKNEFKADIKKVTEKLNELIATVSENVANKNTKLSALNSTLGQLKLLKQHLEQNMPFVYDQFNEQMGKTMTEAKSEIDSFVTSMIHKTGIEHLRKMQPAITHEESHD